MIKNASQEFIEKASQDVKFYNRVIFHMKDGTNLLIDDDEINSASYNGATSSGSDFEVGAAVIGQLDLSIWNDNEKYYEYDFVGTSLTAYIGIMLDSGEIEWLVKGEFNVSAPKDEDEQLSFTCLDNMSKFDKSLEKSKLIYPATYGEFVEVACEECGVILNDNSKEFDGHDREITKEKAPASSSTYRDILSKIAQLGGYFLKCNTNGELEFGWYNLRNSEEGEPDTTLEIRGNKDVDLEDITITGVRAFYTHTNADGSDEGVIAYYPEEGYEGFIVNIDNDLLDESNVFDILDLVGPKIVGTKLRPMAFDANNNPLIEAGDTARVIDRKGVEYFTYITNISFNSQDDGTYICDCETKEENNADKYDQRAKTRNDYEKLYKNMETLIQLNEMPVYIIDNPKTTYEIRTDRETEIVQRTFATNNDCVVVFAASIEIDMATDGVVVLRHYFDRVQDETFEMREYLDKGKHIITITRPIQCQNETRYNFSITAQTEYIESDKRINEAKIITLDNFRNAMGQSYEEATIDRTLPVGIIKQYGIHGYVFGQGLASTDVWDGTISLYDNFGNVHTYRRSIDNYTDAITSELT